MKRIIHLIVGVVMAILLMEACSKSHQQAMPMQQTMDSVKIWFGQMAGDSMDAALQRVGRYLRQHEGDQSWPVRRLKAEWLEARGVWFTAIKGLPDSGLIYTERALREMDGLDGVDELRILALANRADFYRQTGELDCSADGYLQALEAADAAGKSDEDKVTLMLGISTVYTFMGDYDSSGKWWQRTSELLPQMQKGDQFIFYNNVGNDYYFQRRYREACDHFVKAAALVKDDDDKKWDYYTALGNLSEIYVCLGKADSARLMVEPADSFFRKVDFQPIVYYLTTTRMKLCMLENRTADALRMAAEHADDNVTIPAARMLRLEALEQLMSSTGNWQQAYEVHKQMHLLNDSIQTTNVRMQLNTQMLAYEHDKHLLEQQRDIDRHQLTSKLLWALLTVALLIVIVLAVLFLLYRRRQRFNDLKTRQQIIMMRMENTRNRITPHFIYNALSHEVLAQMEGRQVDLNSLTLLLRRGVEQAGILRTTLAEELSFVDYYVTIEGRQMGPDFHYTKEVADDVDVNRVCLPSMIVQIFVENALKHGLRPVKAVEGRQRLLTIRVSHQQQATQVEVIDNGEGLRNHVKDTSQTGLQVVRQTIYLLNENNVNKITFGMGNWQHDGENGCRSWILLPDEYNYDITKQTS